MGGLCLSLFLIKMVLDLYPKSGTPPPPTPEQTVVTGKTRGRSEAQSSPQSVLLVPPKFRGLPPAERLAQCSPRADLGAPLRLTSTAPCPLPGERLGDHGARKPTSLPPQGNQPAVSWGPRDVHRFTCPFKTPTSPPHLPPPTLPGLHPELSGVCPTLQCCPPPCPGFPRGSLAGVPQVGTPSGVSVATTVGQQDPLCSTGSGWTGPGPFPPLPSGHRSCHGLPAPSPGWRAWGAESSAQPLNRRSL